MAKAGNSKRNGGANTAAPGGARRGSGSATKGLPGTRGGEAAKPPVKVSGKGKGR